MSDKIQISDYAACVGLDWSSKEHVFCIYDPATARETIRQIPNRPEDLLAFFAQLRQLHPGLPILLGLEATRASIVPILLQHDFLRLILINPKTSGQYRGMFHLSGAKSDALDSTNICRLIRTHPEEFRLWQPHDAPTRQLATLTEKRRSLVTLRVRVANQLQASLAASGPQLLSLLHCQLTIPIAADFLQRWPTLQKAKAAGAAKLRAFFYKHNVRSTKTLEERLRAFMQSQPILADPRDQLALELEVQALAGQLQSLHQSIARFDQAIAQSYQQHPAAKILVDVPGAGPQLKPRLAASLGTDKNRFAGAAELSCYTGIAPVRESSGKRDVVKARHVRPLFLHQTWIEFANCSTRRPGWARAYYEHKRQNGAGHYTAIRSLAFKWQRVIYACWQKDQPYDEAKHQKNLTAKNPKLWANLTTPEPLNN